MECDVTLICSDRDMAAAEQAAIYLQDKNIACLVSATDYLSATFPDDLSPDAGGEGSLVVVVFSEKTKSLTHVKGRLIQAVQMEIPILPFRAPDPVQPYEWNLQSQESKTSAGYTEIMRQDLVRLEQTIRSFLDQDDFVLDMNESDGIDEILDIDDTALQTEVSEEPRQIFARTDMADEMIETSSQSEARFHASQIDMFAEVRNSIRQYISSGNLYVSPDIPERKLNNAVRACKVTDHEEMAALIDCTMFGSAKDCILFTNKSIYSKFLDEVSVVPYESLPDIGYSLESNRIEFSNGAILYVKAGGVSANRLFDFVYRLEQCVGTGDIAIP
jgi:hypothetical protein